MFKLTMLLIAVMLAVFVGGCSDVIGIGEGSFSYKSEICIGTPAIGNKIGVGDVAQTVAADPSDNLVVYRPKATPVRQWRQAPAQSPQSMYAVYNNGNARD